MQLHRMANRFGWCKNNRKSAEKRKSSIMSFRLIFSTFPVYPLLVTHIYFSIYHQAASDESCSLHEVNDHETSETDTLNENTRLVTENDEKKSYKSASSGSNSKDSGESTSNKRQHVDDTTR